MKLAGIIYYSVLKAGEKNLPIGKTALQKIIFFSLKDEERNQLYVPFHYGPFCFSVQSVCESMVANKYLEYDEIRSIFKIKEKINEDMINVDNDVASRCTSVLNFLDKNGIKKTSDIAFLSKIYFFIKNNPTEAEDFYKFIKEKSTLYGWFEVAKAPVKKVNVYLSHGNALDALLGES